MNQLHARTRAAVVTLVILVALRARMAMAHAGESHADDGLDLATTLGVAGVVAVLGIAWLLSNRVFHTRDVAGEDEDGSMT